MTIMLSVDTNRPEARQEPGPIRKEDEEEDGRNERKEFERLLTVLCHRLDQIEERLDDNLQHVLRAARHFLPMFDDVTGDEHESARDDRTNKKSIRYRKGTKHEEFFCRNGDFHPVRDKV